jgi:hypothetical protein
MTSINPSTAATVMLIFTVIGIAGQTPLPSWVQPAIAMDIQSTCTWLALIGNAVGTYLHLTSSATPGPLVK